MSEGCVKSGVSVLMKQSFEQVKLALSSWPLGNPAIDVRGHGIPQGAVMLLLPFNLAILTKPQKLGRICQCNYTEQDKAVTRIYRRNPAERHPGCGRSRWLHRTLSGAPSKPELLLPPPQTRKPEKPNVKLHI